MILKYKNIPVYFEDIGTGKVVILIHGFLENSTMWQGIMPQISLTHRVICIDLLGHGQTGSIGYIHTMEDMAEAVMAVLNHLEVFDYVVIGHSMGGYVALVLAKMNQEALRGLCLMNSTYRADDDERRDVRRKANKMVQTNFRNVVRLSFTNLFSAASRITYKDEMENALNDALKTSLQGYMAAQEGMMVRPDSYEFFKSLTAKKLIIMGSDDPVIDGDRLLRETKDSDIICHELPYGHMSHIENKSEISYIIMRFIE
ncbi:Pimeloyl-ACP methyl ester carboxylesterase [Formosa sp. Hel1_31_208]|uniref:alpha/beta fold hydrolase n=1 Tax=Formosa sp. Hel1_31_208 TaxID=1798225 RepID=UPI00087D66FA|nr:alpha/beta hydrolase [Formosa sp. Hel1_31_208]SDR70984.1 Pimeloyl-ACP methyl ester carboxylesterase [Formosa sp. Hel1_31_208]